MQTAAASSDPRSPPLSLSTLPSVSSMSSIWNGVPSVEHGSVAVTATTGGPMSGFPIRRPLVQTNTSAHASPSLHSSPTVASPTSPKSNGGNARPPLSRILTDVTVKSSIGAIGDERRPKVSKHFFCRDFSGRRSGLWGSSGTEIGDWVSLKHTQAYRAPNRCAIVTIEAFDSPAGLLLVRFLVHVLTRSDVFCLGYSVYFCLYLCLNTRNPLSHSPALR